MRLLIVTQVVDTEDPVLGFFHAWIETFARHAEEVHVVCLKEGKHTLPENVHVHSLGKEHGTASATTYAFRFLTKAWKLRKEYDCVFVHMNPEYLMLAGPLWRMQKKRTVLWYVHKQVSLRLRLGVLFADTVLTASNESLRLSTKKRVIIGHGIPVEDIPLSTPGAFPRLISVGRIAPVKNQLLILEAFAQMLTHLPDARLTIIGGPATKADEEYMRAVRTRAERSDLVGAVDLVGPRTHQDVLTAYRAADIFVHTSGTGSVDKVVLEALAAGIRVVTTSEAFADGSLPVRYVKDATPETLAQALIACLTEPWDPSAARRTIQERFGLSTLIARISTYL